jgi:oligopeptide transport system ATP-binding protein
VSTALEQAELGGEPALLEIRHVKKYFPIRKGVLQREVARVHAVDDVSFAVREGETLGLVGESGCGKSTLGRTIVRLLEPTDGEIIFQGRPIQKLGTRRLRPLRREMQMVFQDPYASLNPRKRVGTIVSDPMRIHRIGDRDERKRRVGELLETVGLSPEHYNRFPHEFSGGQRQRIGLARALALRPKLIIADEPVSALDVSIQSQMLNLLEDLQNEFQLTYIFIAHDLGVVRHVSDRIAVMYLGKIVELSPAEELYSRPIMPYTEALLSAVPIPDPDLAEKRERIVLEGDVPSPINPPSGCRFHPRCRYATTVCTEIEPPLVDYGNGHLAACHHPLNVDAATLSRVGVAEAHSPATADEAALPEDSSGRSDPSATAGADTRSGSGSR